MAFNVTYHDLLNKNIRHIYSSLPSNIRFRCDPTPGVTLNPHDGCLTPQKKFPRQPPEMSERLYKRLWAYSPEYSFPLPRAPAMRCVSRAEAQAIVDRVSHMTRTHGRRRRSRQGREAAEREMEDREGETPSRPSTKSSSRSRRCLSAQEMEAVTERLLRPTAVFGIRSDLREGSSLDPIEVVARRSARPARSKSAVN